MPVKRRATKRRVDPEREYEIWAVVLSGGYDFFNELPELGIAALGRGTMPDDLASDAWQRFGARHLAEHGEGWAFRHFGPPEGHNGHHERTGQ